MQRDRGERFQAHRLLFDRYQGTTSAAAPRAPRAIMPRDQTQRVVEGAKHLSPAFGEPMMANKVILLRNLDQARHLIDGQDRRGFRPALGA